MNKRIHFTIIAFVLFIWQSLQSSPSFADVVAAVGTSSVFADRFVPVLEAGWSNPHFGIFGSSGGTRTTSNYYNAYQIEFLGMWNPGSFFWGNLTAGFGLGLYVAAEGYRPTPSSATETYNDWTAGPAVRISWSLLKPVFLSVDSTFGLRNPFSVLGLSAQDITRFSVGIQL